MVMEHDFDTAIRRFNLKKRNLDITSLVGLLILVYFLFGLTEGYEQISFWKIFVISIANLIVLYHSKWFAYVWVLLVLVVNMVLLFFDVDFLTPFIYGFFNVLVFHPLYHLYMYKVNHVDEIESMTK